MYQAFAQVAKPGQIDACPHCHSRAESAALLGPRLRELDADVLGRYATSAMHTVGTAEDYRYFAPRLLELVVTGQYHGWFTETVFDRLGAARWTAWPEPQRGAVAAVLDAFWDASLARSPALYPVDEVLCGLGCARPDLRPCLDRWTAALDGGAAALHLAEFLDDNVAVLLKRGGTRLSNAFWNPAAVPRVVGWLRSPGLRAAVEAAFHRAVGGPALEALDRAEHYLGLLAPEAPASGTAAAGAAAEGAG